MTVVPLSIHIVIRSFKILHQAHTYLEIIKSKQNCAKSFQKCQELLQNIIHSFLPAKLQNCRQTVSAGNLPAKPMSTYILY